MASSSSRSRKAKPPWEKLPPEITAAILKKLDTVEILKNAWNVCTTWRRVCQDPSMWRHIHMKCRSRNMWRLSSTDFVKLCRRAVDLSQGQLIGISINGFGTNDLLLYISQRSSQLKQLLLGNCDDDITREAVIKAVKNLPLLEELYLLDPILDAVDVKTVGISCPLLKSFRLTSCAFRHVECDEEALAIASTMPKIRRLRLFGNRMTNVGLNAILRSCLKLELLRLRNCHNVDLSGDLGKWCYERIKDFMFKIDPDEDEYDYYESIYVDIDVYDDNYFDD
ncbi:hypothetical protein ABFX02_08G125300 [Erythranthe guttata]